MTKNSLLEKSKRLYDLGFAIIWLKPKSKAPVENLWTTGARHSWDHLLKTYKEGFNVGVRLGAPSQVAGHSLAVIDVDVKSSNQKYLIQVGKKLKELFPTLNFKNHVTVESGRGNGSCHVYIGTKVPAEPRKLFTSTDLVKVKMPSAPVNKKQTKLLSQKEIRDGYRIRPAWEIAIMGEGQQVVLPPSIHPDTNRSYEWFKELASPSDLIVVEDEIKQKEERITRDPTDDFSPIEVDLAFSDLSQEIVDLILYADCEDRSSALYKVALQMYRHAYNDKAIMSVLTNRHYELGHTAYDHAKTESRMRAANWVYNYTLKKVKAEIQNEINAFEIEVELPSLGEAEQVTQVKELCNEIKWQDLLDRYGSKGVNANRIKPTMRNVELILSQSINALTFRKDVFALREIYGADTEWGRKRGELLTDNDATEIILWFSRQWGFEPRRNDIESMAICLADRNSFNPITEKLESLPEWDGINRLDTWLARNFEAEGDSDYLAQVFRKWLVAMVTRAYEPGAKFDWMPIFEGAQGVGKSSFGRLLVGDKYFLDWLPDLTNKESMVTLQGAWVIELAELASLRKNDLDSTKAFITRTVDKFRPPFGRRTIESPRRCVFFGTTNSDTYLKDDSGNRRFKPVKVGRLNFRALKNERLQLFSEAIFIYKNKLEITFELEGRVKELEHLIHASKMVEDESSFMVEKLRQFIEQEKSQNSGFNFSKFRLAELFTGCPGCLLPPLAEWKNQQRFINLAAKALRAIGAQPFRSHGVKYWKVPWVPAPKKQGAPFLNGKKQVVLTN